MSQFESPRPGAHAGFSLVELLVVLTVLAIASGLFVTQIGAGTRQASTRQIATGLAADLQEARRDAIAKGIAKPFEIPGVLSGPAAGDGVIWFFPDGSSSGGAFTVVAQGAAMTVAVEPFIGAVSIVRENDGR